MHPDQNDQDDDQNDHGHQSNPASARHRFVSSKPAYFAYFAGRHAALTWIKRAFRHDRRTSHRPRQEPGRRLWFVRQSGAPAIEFLSPLAIVYVCVVMAVAYSARGASGFGAAAALPLLALVMPLKVLVPAWTVIALIAGAALIGPDRKRIAWDHLAKLVPGTLVGVAVGLYVFTLLDSETLAKWVGGFILCYGLYSLWGTFGGGAKAELPPRVAAAIGGVAGGMTGTVVGTMGSTFFAVYFDAIKLAKDNYRATMTAILLTLTVVRGFGYWMVGEFTREVLIVAAILLPPMFLGLYVGNRFHHGMSETAFRRTVSGALIASGLALLVK